MSQVSLNRGPAVHLNASQGRDPVPLRSTTPSRRLESEARSVHTERHYDRSVRSGMSQERSVRSNISQERRSGMSQNDNASRRSGRSGMSQKRESSVRSGRSSSMYRYERATPSLISNPDNLVCDYVVNQQMINDRRAKEMNKHLEDKEHANRTNAELKRQLEQEKERHMQKLKLYKEGIEAQNQDLQDRRVQETEQIQIEKKKILKQLADNSDLIAIEKKMLERQDQFREELREQLGQNHLKTTQNLQEKLELEKNTHNLVIDDAWRAPHQRALRNHYKDNLINQLDDNDKNRQYVKQEQQLADTKYVEEVKAYNARDAQARAQIESEKKEILKNELDKQLGENDEKRRFADELKQEDLKCHIEKIEHDNAIYRDIVARKKVQAQGYLKDLTEQRVERDIKNKEEVVESKKPQGTGLFVPSKVKKYYYCAVTKKLFPIEQLNKRYKVAK